MPPQCHECMAQQKAATYPAEIWSSVFIILRATAQGNVEWLLNGLLTKFEQRFIKILYYWVDVRGVSGTPSTLAALPYDFYWL